MAQSHPARGAWIEISSLVSVTACCMSSHPVRGAWIEIRCLWSVFFGMVRGLKSVRFSMYISPCVVAPRKGCVD